MKYIGRNGMLQSLMQGLKDVAAVDPALVPPASLIREFIGGGIYDYN